MHSKLLYKHKSGFLFYCNVSKKCDSIAPLVFLQKIVAGTYSDATPCIRQTIAGNSACFSPCAHCISPLFSFSAPILGVEVSAGLSAPISCDIAMLSSRLSFPTTGPPDPGRVSEGVSEGVPEGF